MGRSFKFTSDVSICLFEGDETEFKLIVTYEYAPAQASAWDEPGHGASVEITDINLISSTLQPLVTSAKQEAASDDHRETVGRLRSTSSLSSSPTTGFARSRSFSARS